MNLLLLFVPTRSTLAPFSSVPYIQSFNIYMLLWHLLLCSTWPQLLSSFFSSPALHTHSGCVPWVIVMWQLLAQGKQSHIPALPSWAVSLLFPAAMGSLCRALGRRINTSPRAEISCPTRCQLPCPRDLCGCFTGFLSSKFSWSRVLLFVQVFKIKLTCNLILLGRNIILSSCLGFLQLLILSYIYICAHIHTDIHVCMCEFMYTQRQA